MKLSDGREFVVIGENVHTTRVLRKKGARVVNEDDTWAVRFVDERGASGLLPVSEAEQGTQDFRQGRIKHVKVAIQAAMNEQAEQAEIGMVYLTALIRRQERAGADFLDLNVDEISHRPAEQQAAMDWLVTTVQAATSLPISIDSSSAEVIETGIRATDADAPRPMLNSASLERPEVLDLVAEHEASVVVTAAGQKGMPASAQARVENASGMIEAALEREIPLSRIYVDPLIFPASVDGSYSQHALDAIRALRDRFGNDMYITGGFSNVSFGIPYRKLINDVFLVLALDAGADSGIVDPVASPPDDALAMNRESEQFRLAEDALLGRDEFCQNYISAWRSGAFDQG